MILLCILLSCDWEKPALPRNPRISPFVPPIQTCGPTSGNVRGSGASVVAGLMHLELIRAQSRRSQARLRSRIALTTLTLVHRVLLLAVAAFRPNDISVAYLVLFLVAHQRFGAASNSPVAFLQLAAAAIVAAVALLQDTVPEAGHVACTTGAVAWAPDVAVLVFSCALLAFATYIRCTRRTSGYALCDAAPRHAGPWARAASGCLSRLSGTVAPLVLGSLAAALLPGALGMPLWLAAHAALLGWALRRSVRTAHARRLRALAQLYIALW